MEIDPTTKGKELVRLWDSVKDLMSLDEFSEALSRTRSAVRSEIYRERRKGNIYSDIKILIFDIETSMIKFWGFRTGQQYVSPRQVTEDWYMLSWAAEWLDSDEVLSSVLTPEEAISRDDKRICADLWELFNEANIIVAHNLKGFDRKKANWRFLVHGFMPPLPYKMVDTLTESRKYFGPTSHGLDYILQELGMRHKIETKDTLWKNCMKGKQKSLTKMQKYNIQDVVILKKLYIKYLPWMETHPNVNLYSDNSDSKCRNCGSDVEYSDKLITTGVNAYKTYRCKSCNHVGRVVDSETTKKQRDKLLR